jgi:hypothetical protein
MKYLELSNFDWDGVQFFIDQGINLNHIDDENKNALLSYITFKTC